MNKKNLLRKILGRKEVIDYSYAIIFFLISSFFLIFAIKPALSIAFSLQREASDLKRADAIYEKNILKLVDIQSNLEQIRDRLDLLDMAVPIKPQSFVLVTDIKNAAQQEGMDIKKFEMSPIDLKSDTKGKKINTITITLQTDSDYQSMSRFLQRVITQKRLKTVKSLQIIRDEKTSSDSSKLRMTIQTDGYYL